MHLSPEKKVGFIWHQAVPIFATSHLVCCTEYEYNSLKNKFDKSEVTTSYQVDWIDYTLQDILGQKFWQYNTQNAKTLQRKSKAEIHRPSSDSGSLKPDSSQLT